MDEQAREVLRCPGCGKEVPDGTTFVLAQEGQEEGEAFSASGDEGVVWDHVRRVRFHPSHFRRKIGPLHYRTVADD